MRIEEGVHKLRKAFEYAGEISTNQNPKLDKLKK